MNVKELNAALSDQNVKAFLWMIRAGEGTATDSGYRTMFGGGLFDSFADHPRRVIKASGYTSTAAGAFQFLSRTWDGLVKQYSLTDFSPHNQDMGAVALIRGRGALADVFAGRIEAAITRCNREWASLPGSPYGQPTRTLAKALETYRIAGGQLAPVVAPEPKTETPTMAPFIPLAISAISEVVPSLIKMFGGGSDISERNAAAAQVVVDAAKNAIGAKNEQELIEVLKADPAAAQQVREAVQAVWYQIDTSGIPAARQAAQAYVQPGQGFWYNPALWISGILLLMPFMMLVDVFFVHPDGYDSNLRTQVVTGVLMVISMVGAFWLGSSISSARKTEIAAQSGNTPGV